MIGGLRTASVMVCGLFLAEDPTLIAVRSHAGRSGISAIGVDLVLAVTMIGYNFAASRYVVSVTSASHICEAIDRVDANRAERVAKITHPVLRWLSNLFMRLNPFDLIKWAGSHLGQTLDRARGSASRWRMDRTASLLQALGAVNVLGVPGAGLALSTSGHRVSRMDSFRHSALFVGSWFGGARLIGWLVGRAHETPVVGRVFAAITRRIGWVFSVATEVTSLPGAVIVASLIIAIVRYSTRVEREARSMVALAEP